MDYTQRIVMVEKPVPELASQADAGIVPAFFCEKVADTTGAGVIHSWAVASLLFWSRG